MTGKTRELYEKVIDRITEELRASRFPDPSFELMISDYELSILEAMRSRFETARARGFNSRIEIHVMPFFLGRL